MCPPHPHHKMLKLTVFQGSPSLTKQPNWAIIENNSKTAILSLKKKKCIELFRSRPTNPINHKSLEKEPKALFQEISWLKLNPINVSTSPPHPKMLKLTVFQGSPSLTKQPNWAIMKNNPKTAILSYKKKLKKNIYSAFSALFQEFCERLCSWFETFFF